MSIDPDTLIFFDASCLIAAAGSPAGGSGFLVPLCDRSLLRGAVCPLVLVEAERNVRDKLSPDALERYHRLVVVTPLVLAAVPAGSRLARCQGIVGAKDAHVLAAALAIQAPYLVTLDQRLAVRINEARIGIQALSPGAFITTVLPQHTDYPSLRS